MTPVKLTIFSDVLCIWAYASQIRIEEVEKTFGDEVLLDSRFCSVFGDTKSKIATVWKDRDGYAGFNEHLQEVASLHPHIKLHPDVWLKTRSASSTSIHLFLKALEAVFRRDEAYSDDEVSTLYGAAISEMRLAFFRDCRDISTWQVQADVAESLNVNVAEIEGFIKSGEAFAWLANDYQLADRFKIEGSPSYVLNEGRQKLYGNLGYNLIKANIQELLRTPDGTIASWC